MVSLFDKANKMKNNNKPISIGHQQFLNRIKKSLYYGPSNPNDISSKPFADHVVKMFDTHKGYSLNTLSLEQITKVRQQTPCSLILSIIYLERLHKLDPHYVKLITPSELFLVTMMVSTKFYSDYDETEVYLGTWADEGNVSCDRMKELEISFLNAIAWNIFVKESEFNEKLKTIERILAINEGMSRGWFTYSELEKLIPSISLAKQIISYTSVLLFSYACSILTLTLSGALLASIPSSAQLLNRLSGMSNISTPSSISTTVLRDCNTTTQMNSLIETDDLLDDDILECSIDESMLDLLEHENNRTTSNATTDSFPFFHEYNPSMKRWKIKRNIQDLTNFMAVSGKYDVLHILW